MKRPERIEGAIIHRTGAPLRSAKPDARSRAPPVFGFLRCRFENHSGGCTSLRDFRRLPLCGLVTLNALLRQAIPHAKLE
jgi:hypothetical protein